MPFGLNVSGDVFQERLDRVLRLVPGVLGITDDIVIHGVTENTHDRTFLVLCETARLNNLSLNSKKMQFKSIDCKFFRHRLTPDGIKVDPKKTEAIIQMDPPQNIASLQSFNGMVNYLKNSAQSYLNSQNHLEDYASLESTGHGNLNSRMHLKPLNKSSQHFQS